MTPVAPLVWLSPTLLFTPHLAQHNTAERPDKSCCRLLVPRLSEVEQIVFIPSPSSAECHSSPPRRRHWGTRRRGDAIRPKHKFCL